jgi:hypothetical protein
VSRQVFTTLLRRSTITVAIIAFSAIVYLPVAAEGAKPPANNNPQFSISASPNPVLYGRTVTITGRLKKPSGAGQPLTLQNNPYPFSGYVSLGTTVTATDGGYSFTSVPKVNTRYRVVATALTPQEITGELTVLVRPKISFRVSDRTPRRGQKVRFSGTVTPAHNGSVLQIQRRSSTGSWVTVAKTMLLDAGGTRSTYARSLRIWRDGVYRTQLVAHVDHTTGTSGMRSLHVH